MNELIYIVLGVLAALLGFKFFGKSKGDPDVAKKDQELVSNAKKLLEQILGTDKKLEDLEKNGVEAKSDEEVVDYWDKEK